RPAAHSVVSLHDALPISPGAQLTRKWSKRAVCAGEGVWLPTNRPTCATDRSNENDATCVQDTPSPEPDRVHTSPSRAMRNQYGRSEEHTSELQSRENLVC